MKIIPKKTPLKKEWEALEKKEKAFLSQRMEKQEGVLSRLLAEKVPDKLQQTLDTAFYKAFSLIFEKGTDYIEKTYRREKKQQVFRAEETEKGERPSRRYLRAVDRRAETAGNVNLLLSGAGGIGMGVAGVGIPDIPVFTSFLLRSLYEIALNNGYDYRTEEEQYFILLLIQTAVSCGEETKALNAAADRFIKTERLPEGYDRDEQIRSTAQALSGELLYMKFLQGVPIVGAVGGAYDVVYMKQISDYAKIKYRRRFLEKTHKKQWWLGM